MPGFVGASAKYGNRLGGIFHGLFRMAVLLLKRGFRPHLKTAVRNIAGDIVSNIAEIPWWESRKGTVRSHPSKEAEHLLYAPGS